MKRKSILSIVAALLSAVNLFAYDFKVDGIYYQINSDGTTVSVTNSGNTDETVYTGDVVIPNSVTNDGKTYAVTEIASEAFNLSKNMKSLTIPESVTRINENSFTHYLDKLIIEDGTTELNIGDQFEGLGIASLYLGRNISSLFDNPYFDIPYIFHATISSVEIGKDVTYIDYRTFSRANPTKATLNCDTISSSAFSYCHQLSSVTIGANVRYIDQNAFSDCPITDLVLEDGDTELEFPYTTFNSDSINLYLGRHIINTRNILLDSINYELGEVDDFTCIWPGVRSVKTGKKITEISNDAFYGCKKLTNIDISNQIKKIGKGAFYGCESAIIFKLPESLTEIGLSAFAKCSKLTTVNIPGVKHIDDLAFMECAKLIIVNMPVVKYIGKKAFMECAKLITVNMPVVKYIGKKAFMNCQNLRYANNMPNVVQIGSSAFRDCTGLESVTIPEGMTGIEPYTFYHCTKLSSIDIPENIKEIGDRAFWGSNNVQRIEVYAVIPPEITGSPFQTYSAILHVPKESVNAYKRDIVWNRFRNIVGDLSSVSTTQITAANVFVKGGVLHIEGTDEDFRIYSSTGQLIYSGRESSLALPHGVYIIILGNETQKVII